MDELLDMPNIGPVLASNLRQAGIEGPEDLIRIGSREAFVLIRETSDPGACLHMLYGLEGAIQGILDSRLTTECKAELKSFLHELDGRSRNI